MDFIKWYKTKIDNNNLMPPENVWEGIQNELDIDQSWYVINKHLNNESVVRRRKIYALAASLLIFISTGIFFLHNALESNTGIDFISQDYMYAEESLKSDLKPLSVKKGDKKRVSKAFKVASLLSKNEIPEKRKEESKNDSTTDLIESDGDRMAEQITNPLLSRNYSCKLNLSPEIVELGTPRPIKSTKEKKKQSFNKLYIGSTGQLANTWLLNEKTYSGLESSNLTTSNASFGSNWGLFIGSNISKNIDVQFEFNILAQNNQDYNEYINGHYVSNSMKFNYSQLGVSTRYNFFSNHFMKGIHVVCLGVYGGYLHNAYQIIDGESQNLTSNYSRLDYGVFLGYEYVIPLYKRFGFGTGVRAYYGLKNVYSGNGNIPGYMNETNNASINISFSLKYTIK